MPDQIGILSENHGNLPKVLPEWVGKFLSPQELKSLNVVNAEEVELHGNDFKHVVFLQKELIFYIIFGLMVMFEKRWR